MNKYIQRKFLISDNILLLYTTISVTAVNTLRVLIEKYNCAHTFWVFKLNDCNLVTSRSAVENCCADRTPSHAFLYSLSNVSPSGGI